MRMTIYVPDDLRKRMDKLKDPPNWSAIACAGFEKALAEVAERKRVQKMDDVIQRLKASAIEDASETEKAGFEAGQEWAKRTATPKQLKRLAEEEQTSTAGVGDWGIGYGEPCAPYSWSDLVFILIEPGPGDEDERRGHVEENANDFWEQAGAPEDRDDTDWLLGFCRGAMDIWGKVADQV